MDENLKNQLHILFASLFHDIGKFKQRAFGNKPHSEFPSTMDAMILPSTEGGYGYQHALWTFDFFENDCKTVQLPKDIDWNEIRDMASKHHKPSNYKEEIIQLADRVSSSLDRSGEDEHFKRGMYLKKHLRSIFPQISIGDKHKNLNHYIYKIAKLNVNNVYPIALQQEDDTLELQYKTLWDEFIDSFHQICLQWGNSNNIIQFAHCINYLLKKYTWCIPAATNDILCDSSLYDHAVSTAAIALTLYNYNSEQLPSKDEKAIVLFAADISGIQQFIFQHHQQSFKGSSKIIRGRSFYISVIGLAYQYKLYKESGILPFTQLMSSSGKFVMLLPNSEQVLSAMDKVQHEIDQWLFKEFHGDFAIITDNSIKASIDDLGHDKFSSLIGQINYNLSIAKYSKFKNILSSGNCVIDINYSEEEMCPACGKYNKNINYSDEMGQRCDFCNTMFTLGGKIVKKPLYMVFHDNAHNADLSFFNGSFSITFANDILPYRNAYAIYTLDESVETLPLLELNNYVPIVNNEIKTFEEIALSSVIHYNGDEENTMRGVPLLSFVKIDVDNLGFIFSHGIDNLSLSRYVTISRMLHYFFNKIVFNELSNTNKLKNTYTVLSGGDDLFLISPLRNTIELIKTLQTRFKDFTCGNNDISFSSGVFICHDNYPMGKASELAEECLEKAKSEGKNKVNLFNVSVQYDKCYEMQSTIEWFASKLIDNKSTITQSFIYRLLEYVRMAMSNSFSRFLYLPRFKYDIARNIVQKDKDKNIINGDDIQKLESLFYKSNSDRFKLLEVLLMLTIYSLRKHKPSKEENT